MKVFLNTDVIEYESDSLYDCLKDYSFFEEYGYVCKYPLDEEFVDIINDAKNGYVNKELIKDKFSVIYDSEKYNRIFNDVSLIVDKVNEILECKKEYLSGLDYFNILEEYKLCITCYGPGGSYYPEGKIVTRVDTYDILKTIIHEIVHIGIEENVIDKYNINHVTKERIVDLFVINNFSEFFDDKVIQHINDDMIDKRVDVINEGFDWSKLEDVYK